MYAVVRPGSITRKSECITAVMVLPAATACEVIAAESARTDRVFDAIVGSFQRAMWNICLSPDVKLVNLDCASGDLSLLSTSERVRAGRLKRPQDRERSLEAHCAIRRILALQLGVDPRYLEFDKTTVGKPSLARPAQNLEFNLSHSGRHGLIAVAKDRSVGVDIEVRRPMSDPLEGALQIATP